MLEISAEQEEALLRVFSDGELGHFSEFGLVIGDAEFIIYHPEPGSPIEGKIFFAHRSEFDFSADGVIVAPRDHERITPLPNADEVFEVRKFPPDERGG